ncbi:MAG: hypothetical protein ACK4FJ_15940 [Ferrovibrio sp.]|uniref:hypothetical protein n=1 Tax=Ferrovibrio sp. TaxID=1917215 RepID=UPI00391A93EE
MLSLSIRPALLSLALLHASGVAAAEPQRPSAVDPTAAAGNPAYRSAFSDYRAMEGAPPQDWHSVNDAVTRTGGHAGALKETDAPETKPDAASPAGHAGHKH